VEKWGIATQWALLSCDEVCEGTDPRTGKPWTGGHVTCAPDLFASEGDDQAAFVSGQPPNVACSDYDTATADFAPYSNQNDKKCFTGTTGTCGAKPTDNNVNRLCPCGCKPGYYVTSQFLCVRGLPQCLSFTLI
jgi:hypothetical protein